MSPEENEQHIAAIAQRFTEIAPPDWARLVGNWEATPDGDAPPVLNYLTLAVVNGGDRWLFGQVGYDEPLYDLVAAYNTASAGDAAGTTAGATAGADDRASTRWTVLDLEVDADGTFRSNLGYGQPKRSNGIMDEESLGRFETYLDTWVAERDPQ